MYKKVNASLADRLMFLFFGLVRVEKNKTTGFTPRDIPSELIDGPKWPTQEERNNLTKQYGGTPPKQSEVKSFKKRETEPPTMDPATIFGDLGKVESNLEEVDGKDT